MSKKRSNIKLTLIEEGPHYKRGYYDAKMEWIKREKEKIQQAERLSQIYQCCLPRI